MSSWKNNQTKPINNVSYSKVIAKDIFSNNYKGTGIVNNYTSFINSNNDELATCRAIRDYIKEVKLTVSNNSDSFWNYTEGLMTPCNDMTTNKGIKIGAFGYVNSDSTEWLEIVSNTLFHKDIDVFNIKCKNNTKTPIIETNTIKSFNSENDINVVNKINFKDSIITDGDVVIKKNLTINNKLQINGRSFFNDTNVKNIIFNDGSKLNSAEYYSKYDIKKLIFDINNGKINVISDNATFTSDTLDTRYYVNNTNLTQTKNDAIINQSGNGVNEIKQTNISAINKIIQKGDNDIITTKGKIGIGTEIPECELHIINSGKENEIVKFSFLDSSELSFSKDTNDNITMNVIHTRPSPPPVATHSGGMFGRGGPPMGGFPGMMGASPGGFPRGPPPGIMGGPPGGFRRGMMDGPPGGFPRGPVIDISNNKRPGKLILHDNIEGRVGICNSDPNYHLSVNGITNSSMYYTIIDSKTRFNGIKVNKNLQLIENLDIYKFEKIIEPKKNSSFTVEQWANYNKKKTNWTYEYGFLLQKFLTNPELKDIVCDNEELLSIDFNSIISICIGAINEVNIRTKKLEVDNAFLLNQNSKKTKTIFSIEKTLLTNMNMIKDLNKKYDDLNNKYNELLLKL